MRDYSDALIDYNRNRRKAPRESIWVHEKTRNIYVVEGHVLREHDLEPCVIYTSGGVSWCRPAVEFFDGRFIATPLEEDDDSQLASDPEA